MGNINMDDSLCFFREIVSPNFDEFYSDYQSGEELTREKLVRIYRKMVNLALTLNHQSDKVAKNLKQNNLCNLIKYIKTIYMMKEKH